MRKCPTILRLCSLERTPDTHSGSPSLSLGRGAIFPVWCSVWGLRLPAYTYPRRIPFCCRSRLPVYSGCRFPMFPEYCLLRRHPFLDTPGRPRASGYTFTGVSRSFVQGDEGSARSFMVGLIYGCWLWRASYCIWQLRAHILSGRGNGSWGHYGDYPTLLCTQYLQIEGNLLGVCRPRRWG